MKPRPIQVLPLGVWSLKEKEPSHVVLRQYWVLVPPQNESLFHVQEPAVDVNEACVVQPARAKGTRGRSVLLLLLLLR